MSVFPQEKIKEVLDSIDPLNLMKHINYRCDTIQDEDKKLRCYCPIHKEIVFRTLVIEKDKKLYRCSYSLCPGHKGSDLIDLFAKFKDISYEEALIVIVEELRLPVELPPTQEFIEKNVEVGENYLTLGEFDAAYDQFSKIIRLQPDNISTLKGLVEVTRQKGDTEEYLRWLRNLIDQIRASRAYEDVVTYSDEFLKVQEDSDIRIILAEAYEKQGLMEESHNAYLALADLFESQGDYDEALGIYRKIQSMNLDLIDVHSMIVQLLIATNRNEEAATEILNQAEIISKNGKLPESQELLLTAIELSPSRNDIRMKYILLVCDQNLPEDQLEKCSELIDQIIESSDLEKAISAINNLLSVKPENSAILEKKVKVLRRKGDMNQANKIQILLADMYFEKEYFDLALTVLDELMEYQPRSIEALGRKAAILRMNDEIDHAVTIYQQVIEILTEEGKLDEALGIYEILRDLKPDITPIYEAHINLLSKAGRKEEAFNHAVLLADKLLAEPQYDKAIDWYRFALNERPDAIDLNVKLADVFVTNGKLDVAEEEFYKIYAFLKNLGDNEQCINILERILTINAKSEAALNNLATCLFDLGKIDQGLSQLEKLATLYSELKDWDNLEKILNRILESQPDNIKAIEGLIELQQEKGDSLKALKYLENLGTIYFNRKEYSEALALCDRIFKYSPQNVSAHQNKILILEEQGKPKESIDARFKLSEIYHQLGLINEEKDQYLIILSKDPELEGARKKIITLLIELNALTEAVEQIDILLDLYTRQDFLDEGENFIHQLITDHPQWLALRQRYIDVLKKLNNPPLLIQATKDTIAIYKSQDLLEGAVAYYYDLIEIEPANPSYRVDLIEALFKLGWQEKAVREYRLLADFYVESQQFDNALQVYGEIKKTQPNNADTYQRIIAIYNNRNDFASAIEEIFSLADMQRDEKLMPEAIETLKSAFSFDQMNVKVYRKLIQFQEETGNIDDVLNSYQTLFEILMQGGEIKEAIEVQKSAIALQPQNPLLHKVLVKAYQQNEQKAEALKELFKLADIYKDLKQSAEALKALDEILAEDTKNLRARKIKAEIFSSIGNEQQALKELLALASLLDDESIFVKAPATPQEKPIPSSPIISDYRFENFVIGGKNNFAFATAMAIAKEPAKHYNPLFLYSDVGLGKTHLLHAIANFIKDLNPDFIIVYTNAEEFTSDLIEAIQNNTILEFRNRYKKIDVLLLDDVQFLAGKERAQEEFFHIFNTLFQSQKQIVITSDRPPKEIKHLEKRLRSRFGAGIIVDMQSPDIETRIAILKRELESHYSGIDINPECLELMAQRIDSNIRQLKGALNQIIASHRFSGEPVNAEFTKQVLESFNQKV